MPPALMQKLRAARELMRLPRRAGAPPFASAGRRRPDGQAALDRARPAGRDLSLRRLQRLLRLFLDKRLVYSCAYFQSPDDTIDAAQERKLDYLCRKLRLRPGQRLLDIGCGWGGLVILAAQRYGVDVTGITLSEPQAELANERIAAAGLADRARVLLRDYREVEASEPLRCSGQCGDVRARG